MSSIYSPPFPPSLHSLTYAGVWNDTIASVNSLTFFAFQGHNTGETNLEAVRLFMLNNQSLESLEFRFPAFEGVSKGPPVDLLNLESLSVGSACKALSTIIRIPALGRLSSLQVTSWGSGGYALRATGDRITFFASCFDDEVVETWEILTGYARPVLRHVRLDGGLSRFGRGDHNAAFVSVLSDAHTLEIGSGYFPLWYDRFREDLGRLGPQLKVIRFAILDDPEQTEESGVDEADSLQDQIEDLVQYRFEYGRPFSAVERMVDGGSERANRQLVYLWRCFYGSHKLGQYVRPT